MTPQKAQIAQNGDRLDQAIDHVATRLTHVDDDPALAARIVASLPERVSWFGWLMHAWVPRLAMVAIVVVTAGLLWSRRETALTPLPAPIAAVTPEPVAPSLQLVVENAAPSRTKPVEQMEPLEPLEPLETRSDHEFSLPALDVEALPPMSLPAVAPIELAPLAIADLPLIGESFPERY